MYGGEGKICNSGVKHRVCIQGYNVYTTVTFNQCENEIK